MGVVGTYNDDITVMGVVGFTRGENNFLIFLLDKILF